jgi:hypothetical protein
MRILFPLLLLATPALAQPETAPETVPETVQVNADPVHLMDRAPGEAATGLMLPLAQTPRAATQVSDITLGRYGVEGLDDLTAITPSSYTGSFYGVDGSVNLRGTLADNYFPRHLCHAAHRRRHHPARAAVAGLWCGQSGRAGGYLACCGAGRSHHRHLRRL